MPKSAQLTPQEEPHFVNLLFDAASTLMLAASATMLTDFSRRLFNTDLDNIGVISITLQAFFVLAASSTFTDAGWSAVCAILKCFAVREPDKTFWRFVLSLLLLAFTAPAWYYYPLRLAKHYNNAGVDLITSNPDKALSDFQRALALNPSQYKTDTNMGGVLETFYRYDDAAKAYQAAITVYPKDYVAYDNLSRVLLMNGNALIALRITGDALTALRITNAAPETISALHKNRALAELDLGLYQEGIIEATESKSAAGDCVLAKIYGRLGQQTQAQRAWSSFLHRPPAPPDSSPFIEPDCILLAEEPHEKD